MRVLVVSSLYPPDTVGGYELGCRQAVDALRRRGHEVLVLTTAPRTPCRAAPGVLRRLRLTDMWDYYSDGLSTEVGLRLKEAGAFQVDPFNVHCLLEAAEEFRPDVVYLWMLVGVGGLGLIGAVHHLRLPWVWHLMDEVPSRLCTVFYRVQPELAREFSRQLRGSYLSCSRRLLDAIDRTGVALGGDVELVPNWVTGPRPAPRQTFYRGGTLRVAAAATVIDRNYDKGVDLLIEAASLLLESGRTAFSIDVFGEATDAFYADRIRALGLTGHVRLAGMRSQADLIAGYDGYDLFAFPGRPAEPFGFAPLEAMSRGCVPVINRDCGVGEWFVHGVHCLKVARGAAAFAGAFRQAIDGEIDLRPMAVRGEAAAWRDFHVDAVLPRIERALARAAEAPRGGAGSAADAYRLALLAGKLTNIFMQESYSA